MNVNDLLCIVWTVMSIFMLEAVNFLYPLLFLVCIVAYHAQYFAFLTRVNQWTVDELQFTYQFLRDRKANIV